MGRGERTARAITASEAVEATVLHFEQVYASCFAFVWRSLRALGVPEASADDAVQDVFIVVHRKLHEFEGRSDIRSWLFAIARRIASEHARRAKRKGGGEPLPAELPDVLTPSPFESVERGEAAQMLSALLEGLDADKREVFVLVELERMPVTAVAEALDANVSTIYSRLRAARQQFERAVERCKARQRKDDR